MLLLPYILWLQQGSGSGSAVKMTLIPVLTTFCDVRFFFSGPAYLSLSNNHSHCNAAVSSC